MHLQENTLFDLWPWGQGHWNVAHYPLHHVTYAPTKFEVATSKDWGEDVFTRKYIIWPLTLTVGPRSHKMLPTTLCIMWPMQAATSNSLRGDIFTINMTDRQTERRRTDFGMKLIDLFFAKEKNGYNYIFLSRGLLEIGSRRHPLSYLFEEPVS